jgi:hypothetical protein
MVFSLLQKLSRSRGWLVVPNSFGMDKCGLRGHIECLANQIELQTS